MQLLKFITCGSVDDGKSTLIGHILYDSKLLYTDQEEALELDSQVGSREGKIDYSLLLDGLMAEREQGITIDVAYRYFTTDKRSFIVADTPGHEEYTRNMAVGASFADLAVILVDAKQGVLIQTRRHARICSLMGIRYFVFAINKMDLVDYSQQRFQEITSQIVELSRELGLEKVTIIPVSATEGDNVTARSENLKWYQGPVLLEYLETVDIAKSSRETGFYMPVQRVCRPNHTFRGFQGQIEAGSIAVGELVTVLPSGEQAHVKSIHILDQDAERAVTGEAVTIQLDREVDVSRGSVLVAETDGSGSSASGAREDILVADSVEADILWMDDEELFAGKNYFVKLGTKLIPGTVEEILYAVDVNTGEHKKVSSITKNGIARSRIRFADGVVVALFENYKTLGEMILIDRVTNMTSACGVIRSISDSAEDGKGRQIDREARSNAKNQRAVTVELPIGRNGINADFAAKVERGLANAGRHTYLYAPKPTDSASMVAEIIHHLNEAGIVVLLETVGGFDTTVFRENRSYYADWLNDILEDPDRDEITVSDAVSYITRLSDIHTGVSEHADFI